MGATAATLAWKHVWLLLRQVLATAHACKFEEALRAALGDGFWESHMEADGGLMPASARALARRARALPPPQRQPKVAGFVCSALVWS